MDDLPLLVNTKAASAALGMTPKTFRLLAESNALQPVTREGSPRRWWRKAELLALAGEQNRENA